MRNELRRFVMSPSDTPCLATVYNLRALGFDRVHNLGKFADHFQKLFADGLTYDALETKLQVEKGKYLIDSEGHENIYIARHAAAYILGMHPHRLIENGGMTALIWARLQQPESIQNNYVRAANAALEQYGTNPAHLVHAKKMIDRFHFYEDNQSKVAHTGYEHLRKNMDLYRQVAEVMPELQRERIEILGKWWHKKPRREEFQKEASAMKEISFSAQSPFDVVLDDGKKQFYREFFGLGRKVRYEIGDAGFAIIELNSTHNIYKFPIPYARAALYITHDGTPVVRQVQGNSIDSQIGEAWVSENNSVSHLVHGHQILYDLSARVLRKLGYPEMGIITSEANQWVGTKTGKKQHMNESKAVQDYDAYATLWNFNGVIYSLHRIKEEFVPVYRVGDLSQVEIAPLGKEVVDKRTRELCDAQGIVFEERGKRGPVRINGPGQY